MSNINNELLFLWSELFIANPLAIKKVEKLLKGKTPLGLDEYDLLLVISRELNQKCRFSLLAEKTLYTKSGVTRVAKRMINKGYIKKETCPEDGRGSYVVLTKNGIKAMKETWEEYSKAIICTLRPCLSESKAMQLRILLSELVENLREDNLVKLNRVR